MSSGKEQLIEASSSEDHFQEIMKRHHARDDNFDLAEVLPTLDHSLLDQLWYNLQMEFTGIILAFGQDQEDYEKNCSLVQNIVTVAMETICVQDPHLPQGLLQTVIILHGVLLSLPEELDKLKNAISRLFELWWKQDMMCRHEIGTHTLMYLMERTERSQATRADVKRVYQLHDVLGLVDFNGESSAALRKHLQAATVSLLYVKSDDGRKFLAHALNQSLPITDMLHKTIKSHLPWAPKSVMPLYGEIYFRAWRNAVGPNLQKLETGCIQDLMYHAILSKPDLATSLRQLLGYLHQQKLQRGLDEMLVNMYDPILWRHLKVANGQVRLQAVSLLIDAFPLYSSEWNIQQRDDIMQKQFDILKEMLFDPMPSVRATVVQGVCKVCVKYWEMIPADIIKDYINLIVNELAYDGASADVRVAVFRGLLALIDNPLTHPMLKNILPQMSNCFHDTSEKVRIAFIDLLLKVKSVRALKFWHIVSVEHLLSRMATDSASIARRLVKLTLISYLPADKDHDEHLKRCMFLVSQDPGAARRFYQYVIPHTTVGTAVRLMAAVMNLLHHNVTKLNESRRNSTEPPADTAPDFLESFEEDQPRPSGSGTGEGRSDQDPDELLENTDTVAGLLEVVAILWSSLASKFEQDDASEIRARLETNTSRVLPALFQHYQDTRIFMALLKLSGFIPPTHLPTIRGSLLSKLKHMTEDTPHDDYAPILEVLCLWGKVKDVLELISDWLNFGLHGNAPPETKNRRSRTVSFADPIPPQPLLALKYINYLTQHRVCREVLLSRTNHAALRELTDTLQSIMKCVEKRLQSPSNQGDQCTDDFIERTFEVYLKLEILLHDKMNKDHNAITVIEQILSWCDVELLALLKKKKSMKKGKRLLGQTEMTLLQEPTGEGSTGTALGATALGMTGLGTSVTDETLSETLIGQKRSAGDGETGILKAFAVDLILRLLKVASDMLLVGLGDQELASHLADFSALLLKIDETSILQFLLPVCRLLYQITEVTLSCDTVEDEGVGGQVDVLPPMLCHILEVIVSLTNSKKEQAERVLPTIRPILGEILAIYYRQHSLNNTLQRDIMTTLAKAIVDDMAGVLKQDNEYEARQTLQELPTLTAFLISLVWRRSSLIGMLLSELHQCVQTNGSIQMEELAALCHVLHTISQCKHNISELKDCVQAIDDQLHQQGETVEAQLDDSPIRHLYQTCKTMVNQSKLKIGMV